MRPDINLYDDHIEIVGPDVSLDANVSISGSLHLGNDGARLQAIGTELIVNNDLVASNVQANRIKARDLEVQTGLDGQVTVSYYTKWDPEIGGYLSRTLNLRPDAIVFSTGAHGRGTTSFDLLAELRALTARVSLLERALHVAIGKAAYSRWEAGGRKPGTAAEDWLAAQHEILGD